MLWEDERYVRLYTRDTPDWIVWPWQSRALLPLLLRKLSRSGVLDLGKHGVRGLAAVVMLPEDVTAEGLRGLLEDGCVVQSGTRLALRNYLPAQEARQSDKSRKAAQRERERADVVDGAEVTKRDNESRNVTESHELSHGVTRSHTESQPVTPCHAVPSHAVPSRTKEDPHPTPASGGAKRARKAHAEASPEVAAVFAHWTAAMESPRSVLDAKRSARIRWALDAYDLPTCLRAIDGCRADPFSMGANDRGKPFNDVTLIFRDAEHVEKFAGIVAPAHNGHSAAKPDPRARLRVATREEHEAEAAFAAAGGDLFA